MHNPMIRLIPIIFVLLSACGGGGDKDEGDPNLETDEVQVSGTPGDDGIFDPAPAWDGVSTLWMSHSSVNWSTDDATLSQVHTRIASSSDQGASWTDIGIDPNNSADWPDFTGVINGDTYWATWRFEVSRLFYDPYDNDSNRRWKMLWHRFLAAGSPVSSEIFENSWIGYSSASTPDGVWANERKMFTGSAYNNSDMDALISPPEFPLDVTYNVELGACTLFTEPGVLVRSEGIYISLQCTGEQKIILLRCDREFSTCDYLGDLLTAADAPQFSQAGQSLGFFGASELVETNSATYLMVTGIEEIDATHNRYSGCLIFRVSDLANAELERAGGVPVLVDRIDGTVGSFNGACGYDPQAMGSGIIYSEFFPSETPRFRMFPSGLTLP